MIKMFSTLLVISLLAPNISYAEKIIKGVLTSYVEIERLVEGFTFRDKGIYKITDHKAEKYIYLLVTGQENTVPRMIITDFPSDNEQQ